MNRYTRIELNFVNFSSSNVLRNEFLTAHTEMKCFQEHNNVVFWRVNENTQERSFKKWPHSFNHQPSAIYERFDRGSAFLVSEYKLKFRIHFRKFGHMTKMLTAYFLNITWWKYSIVVAMKSTSFLETKINKLNCQLNIAAHVLILLHSISLNIC